MASEARSQGEFSHQASRMRGRGAFARQPTHVRVGVAGPRQDRLQSPREIAGEEGAYGHLRRKPRSELGEEVERRFEDPTGQGAFGDRRVGREGHPPGEAGLPQRRADDGGEGRIVVRQVGKDGFLDGGDASAEGQALQGGSAVADRGRRPASRLPPPP